MYRITHCAFAVKGLYSSSILVTPVSSLEFAGTDLKRLSASPLGQGREDCEEDLSLRLLFRDWEACRAVAVMKEEGSYEIASLRSQRQGVVFARSLSDEAISLSIGLGHRALTQQVKL